MITLTIEQAQQIEEALQGVVNCPQEDAYWLFSIGESLATIRAARAQGQAEQDLDTCPGCGGVADNGHDREFPPNPYYCTKCIEQAEQPVSQEYQDHLVNQSFDWAAMTAKHQFMEGYRIGLAEMREKCAKVMESGVLGHGECAAAIRAINFEGDTGFRPVSEMVAEHKQDPKKAAAIEKAKMRKAERDPVTKRLQQQVDYWINHYDRKSPADMELLQKDVAKFAEDAFAASGKPIDGQAKKAIFFSKCPKCKYAVSSMDAGAVWWCPSCKTEWPFGYEVPVKPEHDGHWSDCSVHNEPAYPNGECDCDGYPPKSWKCACGANLYIDSNGAPASKSDQAEYDLSGVIGLTHTKAKGIIKDRGYKVTGFVLTNEGKGKCIVDMSAVRWFDQTIDFQRMMHPDHIAATGKLIENNFGEHTDMAERIADIVLDDHVELMRENERLRRDLDAKDAQIDRLMWECCPREMSMEQVDNWMKHQEPFTESRQCQSNINSPFNACQHKECCCQLKTRVETIDASTKPVEETQESVHDGSTNICQSSTKLVETEQSQSADLSSKTPATHRYTGSFKE
jgi:hypothetical protein